MPEEERQALATATLNRDEEPIETGEPMSTAAQQKYQDLRKKIAEAKKTMEETAKGLFVEMSAELFDANPTLVSFGWNQYTPYWNDGDTCTFSCNGDYPTVSIMIDGKLVGYNSNSGELEIDGEEVEEADEYVRKFKSMGVDEFKKDGKTYAFDAKTNTVTVDGVPFPTYDDFQKEFDKLETKVGKFMKNFEDEDMEVMFGDHVSVTCHRDGRIDTEEYEHD
jgi:hypothetical protein